MGGWGDQTKGVKKLFRVKNEINGKIISWEITFVNFSLKYLTMFHWFKIIQHIIIGEKK